MQKITTASDLKNAIQQLEYHQATEWPILKEQFHTTYESFMPLNIIKSTFKEVTSSPDFKDNLIGATLGLTAGILSKAIIIGVSNNPIKKLFGSLMQLEVATVITKNASTIKSLASNVVKFFSKKKKIRIENSQTTQL